MANQAESSLAPREGESPHTLMIDAGIQNHSELQERMEWRTVRASVGKGRIFCGMLTGMERTAGGDEVAIVSYKSYRVLIPLREMLAPKDLDLTRKDKVSLRAQVGRMLGAEIEFVLRGVDDENRTLIGSRKDAMMKRASRFYLGEDPLIVEGQIAEARVVAVGHQWARLEIFGVETLIRFMALDWQWMLELSDKYHVGDRVLVQVTDIKGDTPETLTIVTDRRSFTPNPDVENLDRCKPQSVYIGTVVNVRKKSILLRLEAGVNAVAVGCTTDAIPGRGAVVCFVPTSKDEERCLVRGILTRVIREAS